MFRKFLGNYLFVQLLFGLGLVLPGSALAVGISPETLFIQNISAASSVHTQVQVSRDKADRAEDISVTISGNMAPYIELPNGPVVTMDTGVQALDIPIIIHVQSLGAGTYEATILVTPYMDPSATITSGAGSAILAGAEGKIVFSVTNEAIELYTIEAVEISDTEEGQYPGFSFILRNDGNVDTRPEKIIITFTDEQDVSNTYTEIITASQIQLSPALDSTTVNVQTHANLSVGTYIVLVEFFDKQNNLIFTSNTNRLQVFPEGTLAQSGILQSFATDKTDYASGELVLFQANFENTGTIGTSAGLVIEIFKDGSRIEVLKPEPVFVPVHKTALIEETYRPTDGGTYTANGYVSYTIFKSNEIQTAFNVKQLTVWIVVLFLAVLSILLGILIFLIHRLNQQRN